MINVAECVGGISTLIWLQKKMIPDPNDPEKTIYVPDDTIRLTNGVISIMNPANISSCKE